MTRTATGLCLAAFGVAATLAAQTTTTSPRSRTMSDRDQISVTGCLQRDASGSYMLANAHVDAAAKPDRTSGAATTTTTTGSTTGGTTTGTTATTTGPTTQTDTMVSHATWRLAGNTADLAPHVGHRVQIMGKESAASSSTGATTTSTAGGATVTGTSGATRTSTGDERPPKADKDATHRLEVTSVRMISSSCS
jgi:hypothetical protein